MAVIQLKSFSGEIPRLPAHALPEKAAQSATSCDFAYGELRGIKIALEGATLSATPVSFWTHDGVNFYTTSTEAEFALSPIVGDTHKRLYYTIGNGADTRVVSMSTEPPLLLGGTPVGYRLGVPGPSDQMFGGLAELGARLVNYDTRADYISTPNSGGNWFRVIEGLQLEFKFFYELNGVKYQEIDILGVYGQTGTPSVAPYISLQQCDKYNSSANITGKINVYGRLLHASYPAKNFSPTFTTQTVWEDYTDSDGVTQQRQVTKPVETTTATAAEATPVLQVIGKINGTQVFSVYSEGSSFTSSRGVYGVKLQSSKEAGKDVLDCSLDYGVNETRAFVYTHVNIFGEESKPSYPVTVDVGYGQTIELYGTFTQPTNDYAPIATFRTYGTNTTSQGNTDWYLASEGGAFSGVSRGASELFSGAQTTPPAEYGERLATQDYDLPEAGTTGLCAMPNGFFAAHRNTSNGAGMNELCFSEPYHPHAWPLKYRMTLPWDIVAIKPHGTGLVVTTKGHPYYVYGTHPESMSSMKLQSMQAGISKRSIVDIGSHVIYASNDGLVAVQNTDVNLEMSQKFFTREKWRALFGLKLDKLALAYHDGNLIGYFTDGVTNGFTIRMDEAAGTYTRAMKGGTCHCVSPMNDTLYFSGTVGAASKLFAYAAGTEQQAYTWHSKDFIMPSPVCLGAGHIILDDQSSTVTLTIYADGVEKQTVSVVASGYFRLKSGFLARRWSVKIAAGRTVKELYLATSMAELSRV